MNWLANCDAGQLEVEEESMNELPTAMPATNPSGNPSLPSQPIVESASMIDARERRLMQPRTIAWTQGLFYVATGLWPLVHMRSFEAVTGRKRDRWLVRTVGLLAAAGGVSLLAAIRTGEVRSRTARYLGMTTAAAFTAVDVAYGVPGRIRRVYLLDAVAELAFLLGWGASVPSRLFSGGLGTVRRAMRSLLRPAQ